MPHSRSAPARLFSEVEQRIKSAVYTSVKTLTTTAWVTPEPVPYGRRREGRQLHLRPGDRWSEAPFDCAWFRFTGVVPPGAAGKDVVLLIDVNGEGCVVDDQGRPTLGLTNCNSTFSRQFGAPGKRVVPLGIQVCGGEPVERWVEAGANDLFGVRQDDGTLKEAVIAIRNPQLYALQYDYEVVHELLLHLPESSAHAARLRHALGQAAKILTNFTEDEARIARNLLAPALSMHSGNPSFAIVAVGHAHLDLAWLWPIRESIRKCARTFATALHLMERYPNYVFGASQAQQYAWVKDHYPDLFERVKRRVDEGRWEVQGAMWVEADINLPGGESLIRQILYGKRFFREEFGRDPASLWEPDAFGYSASLPQILAKSGVPYFMTQKLSWNLLTRHPHDTFWWQGIDGSRVLAHLPPGDTYNCAAGPQALRAAEQNFIDKQVSDRCLVLFGIGDGGGGPGEEHIERLARETDLAGLCPVIQAPSAEFFRHIAGDGERIATWAGELYLERHQGTLTTQARIKRFNRKLEFALRELEFTASVAAQFVGAPYPKQALERTWKEVLLYQFHDILPGSSISRVYEEAFPRYAALAEEVEALTAVADAAICSRIDGTRVSRPVVVMNSLSWERAEWLHLDGRWVKAILPPLGYAVIDAAADERFATPSASISLLENDKLRVSFNADGSLSECFDKENGRCVLAPISAGNVLAVYRDDGDAWDIPIDYRDHVPEQFVLEAAEALVDGPRAVLRHTYRFAGSVLTQDVVLFSGSRRVDFITTVDWHESARMLRTSFPVDVRPTEATCDIQFGSIKRPTHRNTPADRAKFEICAHKWLDLSDQDYGVALLNDCKYGHHVRDNVLDLNLLRSPSYPDPMADRGLHHFTYSLYPHLGDHVVGGVVRAGYELNVPVRPLACTPGRGPLAAIASWFQVAADNIVVETVKRAEDGRGLIVRLYEGNGAPTETILQCGFDLAEAELTNLIEEGAERLPIAGSAKVRLGFRPFEIHTVRLVPCHR